MNHQLHDDEQAAICIHQSESCRRIKEFDGPVVREFTLPHNAATTGVQAHTVTADG